MNPLYMLLLLTIVIARRLVERLVQLSPDCASFVQAQKQVEDKSKKSYQDSETKKRRAR